MILHIFSLEKCPIYVSLQIKCFYFYFHKKFHIYPNVKSLK